MCRNEAQLSRLPFFIFNVGINGFGVDPGDWTDGEAALSWHWGCSPACRRSFPVITTSRLALALPGQHRPASGLRARGN